MMADKTMTVRTIFSETLANLAFLVPEDEAVPLGPDDVWLETVIGYDGETSGRLRLECSRAFAACLASNMLGEPIKTGLEPVDEDAAVDAVSELMNVIAGHWVTGRYGTTHAYQLSIPETAVQSKPPDSEETSGDDRFKTGLDHFKTGLDRWTGSVDGHWVRISHEQTAPTAPNAMHRSEAPILNQKQP